jgi:hypothetical protein
VAERYIAVPKLSVAFLATLLCASAPACPEGEAAPGAAPDPAPEESASLPGLPKLGFWMLTREGVAVLLSARR